VEEIVRISFYKIAVAGALALSLCFAEDLAPSKIRIGLFNLETSGMADGGADAINGEVAQLLSDMGFYKVFSQQQLEAAAAQIKMRIPRHCRDPRCVIDIGSSLGLDRMLYGSIDYENEVFGVRLRLLDVKRKQTVEQVNLEGASGVSASDLLKVAVNRLHGLEKPNESKMNTYFGPPVHNQKEFYIASGVCVGAGLLWALANGGLRDMHLTKRFDTLTLSHISSSPLQISFFGRPAALGDGYVAAADDAYGPLFNPAGMSWLPHREMAIGYQYRFESLNNFVASYVNKATREIGFGEGILYSSDPDHLMSELYFISSYSFKVNHSFWILRPFSIGVSVKLGTITSPKSDDASSSQKTFSGGIDFGFMTDFAENIRFGAVLKDAPGIKKVSNTTSGLRYLEYDPMLLQMGGTYRVGYSTFLICQGQIPLYTDQSWQFSGGIEQEIFRVFKVRLGCKKEAYFDTPWLLTGGFGLDVNTESVMGKCVSLDGAYEYNTLGLFPVTNLSFRIGF
jgi:hypothetical protein